MKQKVGTEKRRLFWVLVIYRIGHVLKLSLLHVSILVYWGELPKSYGFPKPNFHLPDRNNSTDHQDAMRNTNEQNKRGTGGTKNYEIMGLLELKRGFDK